MFELESIKRERRFECFSYLVLVNCFSIGTWFLSIVHCFLCAFES